jgi:hypothetical protein
MKTPFLDFYYSCMKTGRMPKHGICNNVELPECIRPTLEDWGELLRKSHGGMYWGIGFRPHSYDQMYYEFTPLRQNIVLLAAQLNNEY